MLYFPEISLCFVHVNLQAHPVALEIMRQLLAGLEVSLVVERLEQLGRLHVVDCIADRRIPPILRLSECQRFKFLMVECAMGWLNRLIILLNTLLNIL